MKRESLKKELQPYYEKSDCCSWIVELRKKVWDKNKEINRLNNIIDELEKFLKENSKDLQFECSRYYKDILDKLKELKGDTNERQDN